MSYSIAIDKDFYISRHQIFNEFNHCLHYANGSNNVFGRKRRADVNRFTYCFCYAILSSLCYHRVLGIKLTMWLGLLKKTLKTSNHNDNLNSWKYVNHRTISHSIWCLELVWLQLTCTIYNFETGCKIQQRNNYLVWRKQLGKNFGEYK